MRNRATKKVSIKDAIRYSFTEMFRDYKTWIIVPFLLFLSVPVGYAMISYVLQSSAYGGVTIISILFMIVFIVLLVLLYLGSSSSMIWMSMMRIRGSNASWSDAKNRKFLPRVIAANITSYIIISISISLITLVIGLIIISAGMSSFTATGTLSAASIGVMVLGFFILSILTLFLSTVTVFIPYAVAEDTSKTYGFWELVKKGIRKSYKNFGSSFLAIIVCNAITWGFSITIIGSVLIFPFTFLFFSYIYTQMSSGYVETSRKKSRSPKRNSGRNNIPKASDFMKEPNYPSANKYNSSRYR